VTPYQARDELRGLLLGAAAAAVPDRPAVVAFDPGPTGAGALCDGAAATVTSLIRVEVPARGDADRLLATARRHLTHHGWSVVRSDAAAELVAVRDGYTISVTRRGTERRLVLTGETPPLPR
jgi:hypothetical protein